MDGGILDALTSAGEEIVATKHLSIACATVLFYEYLVTFSDEVQYAWRGKKTWVFLLFWLNRYLPIVYKIWDLSYGGEYLYTQLVIWTSKNVVRILFLLFHEMFIVTDSIPFPQNKTSYCSVTTYVENFYLVMVTLFSQLFLAMRVYAIQGRKKTSVAILSAITLVHLAFGVAYIAVFRREAYTYVSLADPEEYTFAMCLQDPNQIGLQLGYLAVSLTFDVIAFLMIAACSYKSVHTFNSSSLFGRVVQDATVYFLVIVWVHLTVMIYVSLMGPSRILMLFPTITNTITPVMICRLVLSLRKATDPNVVRAWNVDHFTNHTCSQTLSDGPALTPIRFNRSLGMTTTDSRGPAESVEGLMTTMIQTGVTGTPSDSVTEVNEEPSRGVGECGPV